MYEIARDIPNVDELLGLQPGRLGAKLLLLLKKRNGPENREFHPGNLTLELWPQSYLPGHQTPYPTQRKAEVGMALSEAWSWLESHGWIVAFSEAGTGWKRLARKALRVSTEEE